MSSRAKFIQKLYQKGTYDIAQVAAFVTTKTKTLRITEFEFETIVNKSYADYISKNGET